MNRQDRIKALKAAAKERVLILDGSWGDEAVGVDGLGLADAMRSVDGLGFDGGVPPGVVEDDVTGGGEVESGSGGAEAEEEGAGVGVILEGLDDGLAFLGIAGEDMGGDAALDAFGFEEFEHLDELAEDENLLAFGEEGFEQFEEGFGFA